MRRTHLATIAALSKSMEAKDFYTGGHTERVADVAVALARAARLHGAELEAIEIGALLHDIGKIGIPERILQKPGPLDDDEWAIMKEHPVISEFILSDVGLHPIVLQVARSSHERIDGGGYPDGLAGDDIPLPARIVLVADAFDALTSDRPYRLGRSVPEASTSCARTPARSSARSSSRRWSGSTPRSREALGVAGRCGSLTAGVGGPQADPRERVANRLALGVRRVDERQAEAADRRARAWPARS